MNLLSPKPVAIKKGGPFQASFEITKNLNYTIVENGVEIQKPIITLYRSKPINRLKAVVKAPLVTEGNINSYHNFQSLLNHCNNNAEALNNQLRDFVMTLKDLKQTKEELMAMDFMGLRNLFSDFLKGYSEIHKEERFNTTGKIKDITSTFFRYITDRNIYTHGVLKLRFPDRIFVMQYIENKKTKIYAELSLEILKSNLETSKELMSILGKINAHYNKLKPLI